MLHTNPQLSLDTADLLAPELLDAAEPLPSSAQGLSAWIETYVHPLADRLARHLGDYAWEISGGFGDSQDVSVHFAPRDDGMTSPMYAADRIEITFAPLAGTTADGAIIGVRDVTTETDDYPPGSAGERAGLNHPVVAIQPDASGEQLAGFLTGSAVA